MRVLRTHLYQRTRWCCKRLCSALVNFFWKLSASLPISLWVIYKHTCLTECSAVYDPKRHYPLNPTLPVTRSCPKWLFFLLLPWVGKKKALKGKHCADVENVKQKTTEVLKGITIDKFKKLFWAVEETSPHQVYCINWSILWRSLNFKHARINTQFFINKCGSFGVPPYILYHSFCF